MKCAEVQQHLPDIMEDGGSAEQHQHLQSCSSCSGLLSDLKLIAREARRLRASEEPGPRVWHSIQAEITKTQSEIEAIAQAAPSLQASEEPSPRVWHAIRAEITKLQSELEVIAQSAPSLQASEEPSPRVWNSLEIALRQEGLIRQPQPQRMPVRSWRLAWLVPLGAAAAMAIALLITDRSAVRQQAQDQTVPVIHTTHPVTVADDEQLLDDISSRTPALRDTYAKELQKVNAGIQDAEQSAQADPNDEDVQQYLIDAYEQKAMVYQLAMDRSLP